MTMHGGEFAVMSGQNKINFSSNLRVLEAVAAAAVAAAADDDDTIWYNIIRYCTQHNNFENKISVTIWTHERHQCLAPMGETWVYRELCGEKWPRDIGSALCLTATMRSWRGKRFRVTISFLMKSIGKRLSCFVVFYEADRKLLNKYSSCRWLGTPWSLCGISVRCGMNPSENQLTDVVFREDMRCIHFCYATVPSTRENDCTGESGYNTWRHQMETFSALLALCAGNSPITGKFPAHMPVTRGFDIFFDLRLNQ